jgi:hypothetical protein
MPERRGGDLRQKACAVWGKVTYVRLGWDVPVKLNLRVCVVVSTTRQSSRWWFTIASDVVQSQEGNVVFSRLCRACCFIISSKHNPLCHCMHVRSSCRLASGIPSFGKEGCDTVGADCATLE